MNKHLLLIPFMALLATSCGGGHITTTPVAKNGPTATALNAPTRLNTQNNADETNEVAVIDLGTLTWNRIGYGAYTRGLQGMIVPIANENESSQMVCWKYKTITRNQMGFTAPYPEDTIAQDSSSNIAIADSDFLELTNDQIKASLSGVYLYYRSIGHTPSASQTFYNEGYTEGYQDGRGDGYQIGYEEGQAYNQQIIANGQYTGLTAFPRRSILEEEAKMIVAGQDIDPHAGNFDMIDTNGNYTIYIKWRYDGNTKRMIFQDSGNQIIGELFFNDVAQGNWSTTWFGKYDAELHYISASRKTYATDEPITMSFYPEVYLASTINGDVNTYFMGGGNAYQLGFADGQTYTVKASETYNNVFTIFTPAFRAVADFFNLNIGPFKVWYFFAIPLIITLLILVLRLVKH